MNQSIGDRGSVVKTDLLALLNERLHEMENLHLDMEPCRFALGGKFSGISVTVHVSEERTIRILIEASENSMPDIEWVNRTTVSIFDHTETVVKFVTSCRMLPDGLHNGFFGIFPMLRDDRIYYIQFNRK